jgi:hypothetical protein
MRSTIRMNNKSIREKEKEANNVNRENQISMTRNE